VQFGGQLLLDDDASIVGADVLNSGQVLGSGNIVGVVTNNPGGELRVSTGERLRAGNFTNQGQINLVGGELETTTSLINLSTGRVSGRGLLRAAVLDNSGSMIFSAGVSDVYGNLSNTGSGKTIVTGLGNVTFYDDVSNAAGTEFRVSTGSSAAFLGTVTGLSAFTGSGTTIFEGPASLSALTRTGTTVVEPSGSLVAERIRENVLIVNGPVTITAKAAPNDSAGTSVVKSLTIDIGGVLDLTNNSMIIDYDAPAGALVNEVRQHLQTGRMTSTSATLLSGPGYGDNALLGKSSFAGQPVDDSSLLVKFTYFGDTDLDGDVDVADLGNLATNWQTSDVWTDGDFDYNGIVNVNDLGLLASNWQAGVGNPLGPSLEAALASLGLPSVTVPEPCTLILVPIGGMLLGRWHKQGN
jgi:hypothetical protein